MAAFCAGVCLAATFTKGAMLMAADMQLADAILAAAKRLSGNGKDEHAIFAYLEYLRCRDPALFNALITKWKKEIAK
jgi:hypothetical protein